MNHRDAIQEAHASDAQKSSQHRASCCFSRTYRRAQTELELYQLPFRVQLQRLVLLQLPLVIPNQSSYEFKKSKVDIPRGISLPDLIFPLDDWVVERPGVIGLFLGVDVSSVSLSLLARRPNPLKASFRAFFITEGNSVLALER